MTKKKLSLRDTFRRQMKWRGMKPADVANLLGVSRQQINQYFSGKCGLGHDNIETLLDYFDLVHEPEAPKERPTYL